MTTYYEILGVDTGATASEIENKLDEMQDDLRQRVTHHKPKVVAEANEKMLALEEIRSTLMDSKKRSAYDASLKAGGLGDPEAVARTTAPFMSGFSARSRHTAGTITNQLERTDAWICTNSKCKHANVVGEQHCAKCGTRIGANCPKCGKMAELSKKFCPSCGVNKEEHFVKAQAEKVKGLISQKNNLENEIEKLSQISNGGMVTNRTLKEHNVPNNTFTEKGLFSITLALIALMLFCFSFMELRYGNSGLILLVLFLVVFIGYILIRSSNAKTNLVNHIEILTVRRDDLNQRIKQEESIKFEDQIKQSFHN